METYVIFILLAGFLWVSALIIMMVEQTKFTKQKNTETSGFSTALVILGLICMVIALCAALGNCLF